MRRDYDDRNLLLKSMGDVHGFLVWGAGALTAFVVFFALFLGIPSFGFVESGIAAAVSFFLTSFVVLMRSARKTNQANQEIQNEYRSNLTAERQKQLDEMLRNNSNIPAVERKD